MAYEFKFPDVGEGLTEGKLVSWKVKVGDKIKIDQTIADVETDKAVVQIPAPVLGTVAELLNKEGDTLEVGKVFMTINSEGENSPTPESQIPKKEETVAVVEEKVQKQELTPIGGAVQTEKNEIEDSKPQENKTVEFEIEEVDEVPKKDISTPKEAVVIQGETIQTKELKTTQIPELAKIKISESFIQSNSNEILAMPIVRHEAKQKGIDLSSIKGTGKQGEITMQDISSVQTSEQTKVKIKKEVIQATQTIENTIPNSQVLHEETKGVQEEINEIKEEVQKKDSIQNSSYIKSLTDIIATPSIRQLARENKVDISTIKGSGENGRILSEDILKPRRFEINKEEIKSEVINEIQEKVKLTEQENTQEKKIEENAQASLVRSVDELVNYREDKRVPFTQIRSIIAKRMLESQQKTASVTHTDEANVSDLVTLKNMEKDSLNEQGIKFSFIPFYIKAFIATAKKYPMFNAVVDDDKTEIVIKGSFDIGIAVDTTNGLLVPVLKNCANKSIIEISVELTELATKAKAGKLTPVEMNGSSFTISSVGSLGGQVFTPIINYPELAILGAGKIIRKPIVSKTDKIIIADMMTFSLTFDHRVLDGADAARFLKTFIHFIEDPESLFLEMS